jgi:peptidoglycan/LPS O-acetylase OafA/YrhL
MSWSPFRLGDRPPLDGLRAVAVCLVLLEHAHVPLFAESGQVGVAMFFVLSGFLITRLLVEERERSGVVDLRRFYAKRVRRLVPAMVACAGLCGSLALLAGRYFLDGWQLLTSLLGVSNWLNVQAGPRGVLSHTWSLSIEWQFYAVWPVLLILLLRRGRRAVMGLCLAGAILSAVVRMSLWSDASSLDHASFGTDTRVEALLVGGALAVLIDGWAASIRQPWNWLGVGAMVGLGALAICPRDIVAYPGLSLVAILTACVIVFICLASGLAWLGSPLLTLIGRRSYGLYIWHYPVSFCIMAAFDQKAPWFTHLALMVPISAVLTWASWRYVESPFLRDRRVNVDSATPPRMVPVAEPPFA